MTLRRTISRLARGLAGLTALVSLAACARHDAGDEAASDAVPAVVGAGTALAARGPFMETLGATGTVTPRSGHVASLGAPAAARVTRVLVATGDRVTAGQLLVELDQTAFRGAAASAAASLTLARQAYDRAQRLAAEGIVPRKDVEQAAAELAKARADAATADRQAGLASLRSPIPGVVTRLTATLGATADPAQPLVEVADPSALDVLLALSPDDAARVRTGAMVTLSSGRSAGGDSLGTGTVADVGGVVDTASRTVAVRVRVPSTTRPLRVSETVTATIAVASRPDAVIVPVESLVPEGDGFRVFVVDSAGVAHARPVTVGGRTAKVAEVTEGLQAGERVVTYGAYGVADSARVVPVNAAPGRGETP